MPRTLWCATHPVPSTRVRTQHAVPATAWLAPVRLCLLRPPRPLSDTRCRAAVAVAAAVFRCRHRCRALSCAVAVAVTAAVARCHTRCHRCRGAVLRCHGRRATNHGMACVPREGYQHRNGPTPTLKDSEQPVYLKNSPMAHHRVLHRRDRRTRVEVRGVRVGRPRSVTAVTTVVIRCRLLASAGVRCLPLSSAVAVAATVAVTVPGCKKWRFCHQP